MKPKPRVITKQESVDLAQSFLAANPKWDCTPFLRITFGDRLVDFALARFKYLLWSYQSDPFWHANWTVAILVPTRVARESVWFDIYDFAHEIGHSIPSAALELNARLYLWWQSGKPIGRLVVITEFLACVIGYLVMLRCGIPAPLWKQHMLATLDTYWNMSARDFYPESKSGLPDTIYDRG